MRLLDIARGQYVRSPAWLRRLVAPAIALIPPALQYGGSYRQWRADIARSETDAGFVAERRLQALRGLVSKAVENSPFWRERFHDAWGGRLPDIDRFQFGDLEKLPVLTREDILAAGENMLAAPLATVDRNSTSGSSGRPLTFFVDKDRSPREWAFMLHVWSRSGYRPGDARCVLRGLTFNNAADVPYEWEPALRELRLSPWTLTEERMDRYLDLIDRFGIRYFHGYPSCIEILCRHMLRTGRRPKKPILGVFPISEPMHPHQRQLIRDALPGATVIRQYGMSERVAFASSIPGDEEMFEFEPLYGHIELLDDDGRPVTQRGKSGRIVATGFLSTGMPFFRYDTGDLAVLERTATRENAYRARMRDIGPRWQTQYVIGRERQKFDLHWFITDCESIRTVSEFQFYQDTPGRCTVRIVPAAGCGEADVRPFVDDLQENVGSAIELVPEVVREIASGARGKRKMTVQMLDIEKLSQA